MKTRKGTTEERFWMWTEVIPLHSCWEWTGCTISGYGAFRLAGKTLLAHRFSYEHHIGKIPKGLFACHRCDNRSCVNPAHLFIGTNMDNVKDMVRKGRAGKKLNMDIINEIRDKYCIGGFTQTSLAREYGVSRGAIHYYVTNRNATPDMRCRK